MILENDDFDARVKSWMLNRFRLEEIKSEPHLSACESASVQDAKGWDGSYGCDTGCEYACLECTISCAHGNTVDFEYGVFGELSYMLEDIINGEKQ